MDRLEKWPPKTCGGFENSAGIKDIVQPKKRGCRGVPFDSS